MKGIANALVFKRLVTALLLLYVYRIKLEQAKSMIFNILLFSLLTTFATSQELTGDKFMYEAYLDFSRTFLMKWDFNETHMVFEVR